MLDFAGDHRRNERLIEPWDFPLRELMELTMWKRDIRRERMDDPDTERSKIEVCACFRLASAFRMPSFGTLNILRRHCSCARLRCFRGHVERAGVSFRLPLPSLLPSRRESRPTRHLLDQIVVPQWQENVLHRVFRLNARQAPGDTVRNGLVVGIV
jgi:hypothetical protein